MRTSYVFAETLRDGTAVTVRAAGANDGPKIRRAFLNLERDTVYTRFFGYKADVSDAELGRIIDWILEKARGAVMRHGINGLVIDPYNEIEHRRPPNMTETEYVSEMLGKVKRFAVNHDVHVWFVAHPVKMQPQNG